MLEWTETTVGGFSPFAYGKGLPQQMRNSGGTIPVVGSNGLVGYHDSSLTHGPTVIVGRKGTVGAAHYCPVPCWPIDTTFWISEPDHIALRFKYYLLKSLGLEYMNADSAVPGLNREAAHACRIMVPPLPEQHAIARILGTLDDKIELNRRMNQTLEAMAQALFKSWFVDFEPFRDLGMQDSPLGEIPTGWHFGVVGDLCKVGIGGDWGQDERRRDGILTMCLRGVDLEQLRADGFSQAPERWLNPPSLEKRKMSENDVLIAASGIGPLGRPLWMHSGIHQLYPNPLTYSNFCKRLIAHSSAHALYLERVLLSMRESGQIWEYSTGTSIPNLDLGGLLSHSLAIPPANVLSEFYHMVSPGYSRLYSPESLTLASIRDTLLPNLLSGEIRVKDAEKFVESRL